ncbi:hypothetical protein V8B97DRAFT_2011724 [Scleroderma yunnanense]
MPTFALENIHGVEKNLHTFIGESPHPHQESPHPHWGVSTATWRISIPLLGNLHTHLENLHTLIGESPFQNLHTHLENCHTLIEECPDSLGESPYPLEESPHSHWGISTPSLRNPHTILENLHTLIGESPYPLGESLYSLREFSYMTGRVSISNGNTLISNNVAPEWTFLSGCCLEHICYDMQDSQILEMLKPCTWKIPIPLGESPYLLEKSSHITRRVFTSNGNNLMAKNATSE